MRQGNKNFKNFVDSMGKNIKLIRRKKNLSQEDLAFELNTAPQYIGCIERGEKVPSIKFLFRIATVLETSIEVLVTRSK